MDTFHMYFAGLVAMQVHPGFNRENTYPLTIEQCADMALEMVRIAEEKYPCPGPA